MLTNFEAGVGLYSASPFAPNWNHISVIGGTLQLIATEWNKDATVRSAATFSYSSDNTNVCTVNSSTGLCTGAGVGVCTITARSDDGFAAQFPVGCALLSWVTRTIAFGQSTTISCSGGSKANPSWYIGTPGCVSAIGNYDPQGPIVGSTITLNTIQGEFNPNTPTPPATGNAHCPVFCSFSTGQTNLLNLLQGNISPIWAFPFISAASTLTITGVPQWTGN